MGRRSVEIIENSEPASPKGCTVKIIPAAEDAPTAEPAIPAGVAHKQEAGTLQAALNEIKSLRHRIEQLELGADLVTAALDKLDKAISKRPAAPRSGAGSKGVK
jgi:hypothetical protein